MNAELLKAIEALTKRIEGLENIILSGHVNTHTQLRSIAKGIEKVNQK
jgi:pyridoxal/pyridoxine/pyridoxamine kinase